MADKFVQPFGCTFVSPAGIHRLRNISGRILLCTGFVQGGGYALVGVKVDLPFIGASSGTCAQ